MEESKYLKIREVKLRLLLRRVVTAYSDKELKLFQSKQRCQPKLKRMVANFSNLTECKD